MSRRSERPGAVLNKLFNEPVQNYSPGRSADNDSRIKLVAGKPLMKQAGATGFNIESYIKDNFNKQETETPVVTNAVYTHTMHSKEEPSIDMAVSQKRLQEAIVWSEILGKPVCKKHRRRRNEA